MSSYIAFNYFNIPDRYVPPLNHFQFLLQVSIMPRSQRHARCRTDVVGETNHPVYDEKFSL